VELFGVFIKDAHVCGYFNLCWISIKWTSPPNLLSKNLERG
jgi:hypothetical protein